MLALAYADAVPTDLRDRMERAARALGVPLATVEALGADAARCAGFVAAAEDGDLAAAGRIAGMHATPTLAVRILPARPPRRRRLRTARPVA